MFLLNKKASQFQFQYQAVVSETRMVIFGKEIIPVIMVDHIGTLSIRMVAIPMLMIMEILLNQKYYLSDSTGNRVDL